MRIKQSTVIGILTIVLPVTIVALFAAFYLTGSSQRLITLFLINLIAVIGFGIYSGNSGIMSFGHVAFMAIGAYVAGLLTMNPTVQQSALPHLPEWLAGWGAPFLSALVIAIFIAALTAIAIGIPLARLSGSSASICTLGFLIIIHVVLVASGDITRGSQTFFGVPRVVNIWLALPCAIAAIVIARLYRDSNAGLKLRASREDEIAATSIGVNARWHRFWAWVLSAIIAASAGALFGHFLGAFSPKDFYFNLTFMLLAMLILGGISTVSGAVLGTATIMFIVEFLRKFEGGVDIGPLQMPTIFGLTDIGVGLAILLVLYRLRDGLMGVRELDEKIPFLRLLSGRISPSVTQTQIEEKTDSVLKVQNVGRRFSGLIALENADFEIRPGQVIGLIGPNGAGKSTLINCISAVVPATSGQVLIDGKDVTSMPAHKVPLAGLGRTFQNIRLFKNLTVLENVAVAVSSVEKSGLDSASIAQNYLDEVGLGELSEQLAGTLSYGAQRRLEIARALALRPRYLLLDEPAAGMNPTETEELMHVMNSIRHKYRLGLLIVEHDLKLIMRLCDVVVVLNKGVQIAVGTPAEIQANPDVIEAYIGRKRSKPITSAQPAQINPEAMSSYTADNIA